MSSTASENTQTSLMAGASTSVAATATMSVTVSPPLRGSTATRDNKNKTSSSSSPFSVQASPILNDRSQTDADSNSGTSQQQQEEHPFQFSSHAVCLPTKAMVQLYFQQVMSESKENDNNINNENDNDDNSIYENVRSDQVDLLQYGILSLEDVLLPAIAHVHDDALKGMQKLLMRDAPDRVAEVVEARKCLVKATALARRAAATSRTQHRHGVVVPAMEREAAQAKEKQAQHLAKVRALERMARFQEQKKMFPPNQELWREVAYLMTEKTKLEKEERLWKQTEAELEMHMNDRLRSLSNKNAAEAMDVDSDVDDGNDDDGDHDKDQDAEQEKQTSASDAVMEAIEDMQLSCTRLDQALQVVHLALEKSEHLRRQAAVAHKQDRFAGYGSQPSQSHRTKDLIRLMSQEESV